MYGRKKLWFLILAAGLVIAFFVYRYVLAVALSSDCGNSVLSSVASPDGGYIATVSERNCGATTPYQRVVSIRHKAERFDGNNKRAWIFEIKDQPSVNLNWSSQRRLTITYSPNTGTILNLSRWEDVEIAARQSE
jgi:hypothetical protein